MGSRFWHVTIGKADSKIDPVCSGISGPGPHRLRLIHPTTFWLHWICRNCGYSVLVFRKEWARRHKLPAERRFETEQERIERLWQILNDEAEFVQINKGLGMTFTIKHADNPEAWATYKWVYDITRHRYQWIDVT